MATGTSLKNSLLTTRDALRTKMNEIRTRISNMGGTLSSTMTLTTINTDITNLTGTDVNTAHEQNCLVWQTSTILPTGFVANDICYGNNVWVAVGYVSTSGYIAYSVNGFEWTLATAPTSVIYKSVAYGNSLFIAIPTTSSSFIATSSDGITWTESTTSVTQTNYKIIYANSIFLIVGNTNKFLTSANGSTWYQRTAPATGTWISVHYTGSLFIAIQQGSSVAATSSTGTTWTSMTLPSSDHWTDVSSNGDSVCIILGDSSATSSLISTDSGTTWETLSIQLSKIVYGNRLFLADDGSGNRYCSYNSGDSWILVESALGSSTNIGFANNKFFILTTTSIYNSTAIRPVTSDNVAFGRYVNDGYTNEVVEGTLIYPQTCEGWELRNSPLSGHSAVCYGNGRFVAFGYSAIEHTYTIYSLDGITWTRGNDLPVDSSFYLICYGNGKFIAISENGEIVYSLDGITWKEVPDAPVSATWTSICYGNDKFVAISDSTYTMYSTDGIFWYQGGNAPVDVSWNSVCYGNGVYAAVSGSADSSSVYTMYSTDGITWIQGKDAPLSSCWYSVCYGNGKFVAVSIFSTNYSMYSLDGILWLLGTDTIGTNSSAKMISFVNGKFLIIERYTAYAAYSTDGSSWTTISLPISTEWYSMCYGNGKCVVVSTLVSDILSTGKVRSGIPNIVIGSFIPTASSNAIVCNFRPDKVYVLARGLASDAHRYCKINITDSDKFKINGTEVTTYTIYNSGTTVGTYVTNASNVITDTGFTCIIPTSSLYDGTVTFDYYAIGTCP